MYASLLGNLCCTPGTRVHREGLGADVRTVTRAGLAKIKTSVSLLGRGPFEWGMGGSSGRVDNLELHGKATTNRSFEATALPRKHRPQHDDVEDHA